MQSMRAPFNGDGFIGFLEANQHLSSSACERVRLASLETGTSPERVVLELGLLAEDQVFRALANYLELRYIELKDLSNGLVDELGLEVSFLARVRMVPVAVVDETVILATADPQMEDLMSSMSFSLGMDVEGAIASPSTVASALRQDVGDEDSNGKAVSGDIERLRALANDGPIIGLVNDIIAKAVSSGASDIHLEAQAQGVRVRFRVDGLLETERLISDDMRHSIASRIKIMADLNISEKRRPQDGRVETVVRGRAVDIRVSTLPTQMGESIVMRLLDRDRVKLDWDALNFPTHRVAEIRSIMAQQNGIFLVAGPTGSGKTTTLYTALQEVNTQDRKIVTVEDPVEYTLEGVNQVQVNEAVDMTFSAALRAILRQDPNVVMVGEIRDEETAEIAVRAALIGRLVLSTIHTNDAVGAIDRLLDLGVAPYLIGSTLRGVLSQRLVRRQCAECGGKGCEKCNSTGLRGRLSVSEMLTVTPEISEAISAGSRGQEMHKVAKSNGFTTLESEATRLIEMGAISQVEVHRSVS